MQGDDDTRMDESELLVTHNLQANAIKSGDMGNGIRLKGKMGIHEMVLDLSPTKAEPLSPGKIADSARNSHLPLLLHPAAV